MKYEIQRVKMKLIKQLSIPIEEKAFQNCLRIFDNTAQIDEKLNVLN